MALASSLGAYSCNVLLRLFVNMVWAMTVIRAPPRFWEKTKVDMAVGICAGARVFCAAIMGCDGQIWGLIQKDNMHTIGRERPRPVPERSWNPVSCANVVEGEINVNKPEPIELNAPPAMINGR